MLEVVAHTARVAHAACGDDDLRRLILVYRDRVLFRYRELEAGEHERVHARADDRLHLLVDKLRVALEEHRRRLDGEGAVHIDGEVRVSVYKAALLDLAYEVQDLLCAADGKGGDNEVPAGVERRLDELCKLGDVVRALGGVQPVAVGGFYHEVVRALHKLRVAEDGLIDVADIAAEADAALLAVFVQPYLYCRRAEQMPHVGQADGHAVIDLNYLVVPAGDHSPHYARDVVKVVYRLDRRAARAHGLAGFPLCLLHLDVRRVAQHYVAQLAGRGAGVYRAAEALLIERGQHPGVVDVRMGQQHKIQLARGDGQGSVLIEVPALLHAVIDNALLAADFDISAAAGHFMRGAYKSYLHSLSFFLICRRVI